MGRKKFTRMIKARVDDETYMKAKELAEMMTNGKLAELIRQLIKVAYGVEKTEGNGSSNCSELPLFLEVMAPALESGSTLQAELFYTVDEWGFRNRDVINRYVWDGCGSVISTPIDANASLTMSISVLTLSLFTTARATT